MEIGSRKHNYKAVPMGEAQKGISATGQREKHGEARRSEGDEHSFRICSFIKAGAVPWQLGHALRGALHVCHRRERVLKDEWKEIACV